MRPTINPELSDYFTDLTGITIHDNGTTISSSVFVQCDSLTVVNLPASASVNAASFVSCRGLTAINVHTNNLDSSSIDGVLFNKSQTVMYQFRAARPA